MRNLGCNTAPFSGNSIEQNMETIKKVGFNCTSFDWNESLDMEKIMLKATELNLEVESIKAPFEDINCIWEEGTEGDYYTEKLRCCIKDAAKYKIPYVIMQTTVTNSAPKTSHIALIRFGKLVREAEKQGIKILFKNAEFFRHLSLVLYSFKSGNVGFCYDIGQEVCYTPGLKYLSQFSNRLLCTIFSDNDGFPNSKIVTSEADHHKIPFDGSIDFNKICIDIKNCGYTGSIMLEVYNQESLDFYKDMTMEQFYSKAYSAAVKLSEIIDGD